MSADERNPPGQSLPPQPVLMAQLLGNMQAPLYGLRQRA